MVIPINPRAIKNRDELLKAVEEGKSIYLVDNRGGPWRISKLKWYGGSTETSLIIQKGQTGWYYINSTEFKYYLWVLCVTHPDEGGPPRTPCAPRLLFTNYWDAWAYWNLKKAGQRDKVS